MTAPGSGAPIPPVRAGGYFASRWHSAVDLRVLFWRDMLAVGTVINLAAGFSALLMLSVGVPAPWALLVLLAPVPYNFFLVASVRRAARRPAWMLVAACIWFVAMLVI